MVFVDKFEVFFVTILCCFLFSWWLHQIKWFRWAIIVTGALILTYATIFIFSKPSSDWAETDQKRIVTETTESDFAPYKYVWSNFILVDNSFDKTLIPNVEFDSADSLNYSITDRRKLSLFFELLDQNKDLIDFAVCDIGFTLSSPHDTALKKQLDRLIKEDKILFSGTPDRSNQTLTFPDSVCGNAIEQVYNRQFSTHFLLQQGKESLPYKIYRKMNHVSLGKQYLQGKLAKEQDSLGRTYWLANPFFPAFAITNESLLLYREGAEESNDLRDHEAETHDLPLFHVGETLSESGAARFQENLRTRKKLGMRNIVFLGSFTSPDEDIHQTVYKSLHGPVILLNILYALTNQKHHLSTLPILLLFFGFLAINAFLIHRSLQIHVMNSWSNKILPSINISYRINYTGKTKAAAVLFSLLQLIVSGVGAFLEFLLFEEPHFTLLFALAWFVSAKTGMVVNILFLISYYGTVYICLGSAFDRIVKPKLI